MHHSLQQPRAVRVVPRTAEAAGWFRHVVRPLMSPPVQVVAALDDAAAASARGRGPYAGRCFGAGEGAGCPLSLAEQRIAARVDGEPMSWEAQ